MKKRLNLGPAITFSIQSVQKHLLLIMVPVGIQVMGIILMLLGFDSITKIALMNSTSESMNFGFFPLLMLGMNLVIYINLFIQIVIQIAITRVGFKIYQGEEPSWKDVMRLDWSIIWKSIGCTLLLGIYFVLATFICLIPGIILYFVTTKMMLMYRIMLLSLIGIPYIFFYFYLIATYQLILPTAVDTRDTVDRILQKSAKVAKGVKWALFGYFILLVGVSVGISQSTILLKKHGFDWLYYVLYGILSLLFLTFTTMIPIYLYKDLMRQQTQLEAVDTAETSEGDLTEELEEEQAEELVEESPEL